MKKIILTFLLVTSSLLVHAQGLYYNTWCFGDSAMFKYDNGTFDSTTPSSMRSYETCASISDSLGNLLFYTNGIKIWNKLHQQMPNTDSINFGPFSPTYGSSTTQGAVISVLVGVPFPSHAYNHPMAPAWCFHQQVYNPTRMCYP